MTYQYVTRQAANARAPAIDSAQAHEHTCRAQARANTATPIVTSVKSTARLRSVTRAVRSFHGSDIHVMLALRHSSRQIVVTDEELNGPDVVGELLIHAPDDIASFLRY